jgi:hypothetical protein
MQYYFAEEEWRAKRLQKALRLASAMMGTSIGQLELLIQELSDYNGKLHVIWKHDHTPQQELAFKAAWSECGESVTSHFDMRGANAIR